MKITIKRIENGFDCIRGVLLIDDVIECCTLELPYLDNKTNISSIPTGVYTAKKHNSPNFNKCIKVFDVPNRTDILIHIGNIADDSKGCIIVGSTFGKLNGHKAVLSSKIALDKLLDKIQDDEDIELTIINCFN